MKTEQVTFNINEIDTKAVDVFNSVCATGNVTDAAKVANVIMKYSHSDQVRGHVRQQFSMLLAQVFPLVLGGASEEFGTISEKLLKLYCNRANKKLDISKDIEHFSKLATKYVGERITLLHYDRLYTLYQSVMNTANVEGDIVELGVYRGGSCKFMLEMLDIFGIHKNICGFDTFRGHARVNEHDSAVQEVGFFGKTGGIDEVRTYISDPRVALIEGDVSDTFAEFAKQRRPISFAHLDMDVHKPTADALPLVFDLLSPRGVILMDDYGFTTCPGVKVAVDDFLRGVTATTYHLMTGQMVIVK